MNNDRKATPEQMRFTVAPHNLAEQLPLIYMWEIRGPSGRRLGCYVGQAETSKRPRNRYRRNVRTLLAGKPYHIKGADYRRGHYALAEAHVQGHTIELHFLCNVKEHQNINEVEQQWIKLKESRGDKSWQLNDKNPCDLAERIARVAPFILETALGQGRPRGGL